jgi:hypothetical protein
MSCQCNFCGHSNPPGAKYCNECGSPLNFKPCAECGAVNEASAPGCYKCGAKLPDRDDGIEDRPDRATPGTGTLTTSHRDLSQEIPVFDTPWRERGKRRTGRLTLLMLVATAAAVAGYMGHGLLTGGDVRSHPVGTSEGGTTSSSDAVPSRTTDRTTGAIGNAVAPADSGDGGRSPVTVGATAISESAQETTTAIRNAPPMGSPAPAAAEAERRPEGADTRTAAPSALPGADVRRIRPPAGKASVKSPGERACTQQQRVLGLCG